MSLRNLLLLGLLALAVTLLVSAFQSVPGYMDAEYYYLGAVQLFRNQGFHEPILWNFLDNPQGIPHPSHAYWMPLTSLLAASGMFLTGGEGFSAAKIGFLALATLIPPLTARLAYSLTRRSDSAWLSGLLAVFSGFYLPYMTTTDAFGLLMLLGGLIFVLLPVDTIAQERVTLEVQSPPMGSPGKGLASPQRKTQLLFCALLGVLSGFIHLTRSDGILWVCLLSWVCVAKPSFSLRQGGLRLACCWLGYLLVMGGWFARNLSEFGAPFAPGGFRTLWLTNYNELYIYPAHALTLERWWQSGLKGILSVRLWATGQNLQTALAVQGGIFMVPLMLLGFWRLRKDLRLRMAGAVWSSLFVIMTFVFPFAGARGGFFHAGAAVQCLLWALSPVGLDVAVEWAGRLRRWNIPQARRVFQWGLLGLAVLLSVLVFMRRVIGSSFSQPIWVENAMRYQQVERTLMQLGASKNEIALVNNPPGYYLASGRACISIPYGDIQTVLAVAERYGARYLVLEFNQLLGEDDLFAHPGDRPGLRYLTSSAGARIYQLEEP